MKAAIHFLAQVSPAIYRVAGIPIGIAILRVGWAFHAGLT